jgi:hypothetical protein
VVVVVAFYFGQRVAARHAETSERIRELEAEVSASSETATPPVARDE